jgi:hypothetical protein
MSHLYQISLSCVIGHQMCHRRLPTTVVCHKHVKVSHDVIGHLMCHRRLPTTDFQSCREGGVKKCFLGLRQTALLSAEGKKHIYLSQLAISTTAGQCGRSRHVNLVLIFLHDSHQRYMLLLTKNRRSYLNGQLVVPTATTYGKSLIKFCFAI